LEGAGLLRRKQELSPLDFAVQNRKFLAGVYRRMGLLPRARARLAGEKMQATLKKALRTLQSELPFVKEAKDGLYLYARRRLRIPHERDFEALRLIPKHWPGSFLDVGANQGQSIESIRLFRPDAEVISFEPNPGLARTLASRYERHKNVHVIAKGLGDSPGRFTLFVPSYKGFLYDALGSLDKHAAGAWISDQTVFRFDAEKLSIAEMECQVDTLDAQQLTPVFIKLDVQGYEYNVLLGGRETLKRYEPILLVETFRDDARTVQLAEVLGYDEYHYKEGVLRKGPPSDGPNSFLITPRKVESLVRESPGAIA
jgi:FkbM family methyltransferase